MMAKYPEQRPTLEVMRKWFATMRSGASDSAAPPALPAPDSRPTWIFIAIALAVLAATAMSFVVVRSVL